MRLTPEMLEVLLFAMLTALRNRIKGFPVAAMALSSDYKRLGEVKTNGKGKAGHNHENHAENLLLLSKEVKDHDGKVILIITFPPCSHCLVKIKAQLKDVEIYYLFDLWRKVNKRYIVNSGMKIQKLKVSSASYEEMKMMISKEFSENKGHKKSFKILKRLNGSELFYETDNFVTVI